MSPDAIMYLCTALFLIGIPVTVGILDHDNADESIIWLAIIWPVTLVLAFVALVIAGLYKLGKVLGGNW